MGVQSFYRFRIVLALIASFSFMLSTQVSGEFASLNKSTSTSMDQPSLQHLLDVTKDIIWEETDNEFLVDKLQSATQVLSQCPQLRMFLEEEAAKIQEETLKLLATVVTDLLEHDDKNVRLLVASCVTELFRVMVPERPFKNGDLRNVFKLIVDLFEDLDDHVTPNFFVRVTKVLNNMAASRCCVIMLHIDDCTDLVLQIFNNFFSVVSDILIGDMTSIMKDILKESLGKNDLDSIQLLKVILQNFAKQNKDAAYQLAASVLQDWDPTDKRLEKLLFDHFIKDLNQKYFCDQIDLGTEAHNLLRELAFAFPSIQTYVFQCILKENFADSPEVMTRVVEGLLDSKDKELAVQTAYDLFSSDLTKVKPDHLRLFTKILQVNVRTSVLPKLVKLYHDYCQKCCEGSMTICSHFEEIPCEIIKLCYFEDFGLHNLEAVFADYIFPEHLSIKERINHWIHMFSLFQKLHQDTLNSILTQKKRFQDEMKNYLDKREILKEICSEERQKKIESLISQMAAFFPDSHRAENGLHMLNKIEKNSVFELLKKLLEEQAVTAGQTMKGVLLVMIEDSIPDVEFSRSLISKCSSNMFSTDHIECILEYLSDNENRDLKASCAKLLLVIVGNFPSMLRKAVSKRGTKTPDIDELIKVIAKALTL